VLGDLFLLQETDHGAEAEALVDPGAKSRHGLIPAS
jgi:hypothetical protein